MGAPLNNEEVLARYDRYVREFLEVLNVCPFARRAREGGTLRRAVLRGEAPAVETCVAALMEVTSGPAEAVDVAVLILPDFPGTASEFSRYVSAVRQPFTRQSNPPGGFYLVAMHPEHVKDLSNPDRAVAFMRRTPHPSIQVARASVMQTARGTGTNAAGESTSEVVARVGLENVKAMGEAQVEALLNAIRGGLPR